MYHALAYSGIMCIQALLKFEQVQYDYNITFIILLTEKFVPFDWLRADVFQLNLKYLHVKITVTVVTQNHQIISLCELCKNGGKISRF